MPSFKNKNPVVINRIHLADKRRSFTERNCFKTIISLSMSSIIMLYYQILICLLQTTHSGADILSTTGNTLNYVTLCVGQFPSPGTCTRWKGPTAFCVSSERHERNCPSFETEAVVFESRSSRMTVKRTGPPDCLSRGPVLLTVNREDRDSNTAASVSKLGQFRSCLSDETQKVVDSQEDRSSRLTVRRTGPLDRQSGGPVLSIDSQEDLFSRLTVRRTGVRYGIQRNRDLTG